MDKGNLITAYGELYRVSEGLRLFLVKYRGEHELPVDVMVKLRESQTALGIAKLRLDNMIREPL